MAEQPVTRYDRVHLARNRLRKVLGRHSVALFRTLEQKIADAGPKPMRINPHILTEAKQDLVGSGEVRVRVDGGSPWFYLANTDPAVVTARLAKQLPIHARLREADVTKRIGQTLEIAIFKALRQQQTLSFHGAFVDLDKHDDSTLYSKKEPPGDLNGRFLNKNKSLDFLIHHPTAGYAGIEAKNLREWLYPDRAEVLDLLHKCCTLDIVPVLIARRYPFVTFKLLNTCGVVVHETYNQMYPASEADFAAKAADKMLLGYHDIRVGTDPDKRLLRFLHVNLPKILPAARERFDQYKDLLSDYASGPMEYAEFAARVRRRSEGAHEDFDEPPTPDYY